PRNDRIRCSEIRNLLHLHAETRNLTQTKAQVCDRRRTIARAFRAKWGEGSLIQKRKCPS
ncbi:MAG: hypothetical protein M3Y86_06960, partial [Verrucomicrobiota bacterium]|nr:hypothetical protein [Verrucomicrobiota bacterium]